MATNLHSSTPSWLTVTLAAPGTPEAVAWPASGRPQVRDAASDAGGAPRSKRTSSRRPSRTPTISCPSSPAGGPKPDRDRPLDPSVRKLIDQRRHRPVGGQPALPDRLTQLRVVADHVHGELALVRRRQRLASAGRGDRLARAVERRVQQQRLLLRVVVERRPHVGWLRLLGALRVSEDRRDRDHAAFAVAQPIGDARPLQRRPHGVACALRSRPPGDHLDVQLSARHPRRRGLHEAPRACRPAFDGVSARLAGGSGSDRRTGAAAAGAPPEASVPRRSPGSRPPGPPDPGARARAGRTPR